MPIDRRRFLAAALALGAAPSAIRAAGTFPDRPIRVVVPLPPGGPTDAIARGLAQAIARPLGQPVVVDNRPGADGAIAAKAVAGAPADGHTLLFVGASLIATPLLSSPPAFDWSREFAPVGSIGRLAFGAAVHPDVPARTLGELAAWAKANPDRIAFATSTNSELLAAAQFMRASGTSMTRVAYKGGTQALPDLVAGRIQLNFGPLPLFAPHAKEGRLRVLATLLPRRSPLMPDVPTAAEAGFPSLDVPTWQGLFAPARTPEAVVARLSSEVGAASRDPELRADLERRAVHVEALDSGALGARVATELGTWAQLIDAYRLGAQ